MKIETSKFEKTLSGWDLIFTVYFSEKEEKNFNPSYLQHDGSYNYTFHEKKVQVSCDFPKEELYPDETIDARIKLIKEDIVARIKENIE